jgi:hypothetical protein
MNLSTFIKANFLAGLFGTLVLSPFAWLYEFVTVGSDSALLKFGPIDVLMVIVASFLMAALFSVTALAAFPIVKQLQRKGLVSLAEAN